MRRKLTITIDEAIYDGLHEQIGRGHISSFIEELVRPHLLTASTWKRATARWPPTKRARPRRASGAKHSPARPCRE